MLKVGDIFQISQWYPDCTRFLVLACRQSHNYYIVLRYKGGENKWGLIDDPYRVQQMPTLINDIAEMKILGHIDISELDKL